MSEEMKMSDVFGFGEISNYEEIVCKTGECDICFLEDSEKAKHVAHAINNHDRLTEENRKLRELLFKHKRFCNEVVSGYEGVNFYKETVKLLSEQK